MLLQFDALQLLTGGADGRVRRWMWSQATAMGNESSEGEASGERVTRHFVAPGDSLANIASRCGSAGSCSV